MGWTYPVFGEGEQGSDFNDLAAVRGKEEAMRQLSAIQGPPAQQRAQSTKDKGVPENTEEDATEVEITRLAGLSAIEYERQREAAAEALGIKRVSVLDKLVKVRRQELEARASGDELIDGIEPWPEVVRGLELADTILATFKRYTILPDGGGVALTLWALGTYCNDAFRIFPKLCISSPEKRCGKTTTMETLGSMTHRALVASNVSPSVIFRSIDLWHPSLLIDEGDTFVSDNEELRGIINSGHTRSTAFVLRTEGEGANRQPRKFSTWGPMAIAMIKTPPDTIRDRSVMVTLRRKLPGESVQRLPLALNEIHKELRQKCKRWGLDSMEVLSQAEPKVPSVGNDRAEDNWWALLAIADLLGGEWPTRARSAMLTIEGGKESDDEGIGPMILADIREVFQSANLLKLHSQELVDYLVELDDRPWAEWKGGKPMSKASLAKMLKPFSIKSRQMKIGSVNKNGYEVAMFEDAFARYLPSTPIQNSTTLPASNGAASSHFQNSTQGGAVEFPNSLQPSNHAGGREVEFQTGGIGECGEAMEEFAL